MDLLIKFQLNWSSGFRDTLEMRNSHTHTDTHTRTHTHTELGGVLTAPGPNLVVNHSVGITRIIRANNK